MAKFCTKCGKELKEGKTCNCKNNFKKNDKKVSDVNNILDIFKNIIKKPIDTTQELINSNDMTLSFILTGINIFVISLVCLLIQTETYYLNMNYYNVPVNIPYIRYFMQNVIFFITTYLVISGTIFVIFRIFNINVEYKKIFNMCASVSIPIAIAAVANIFLIYIWPELGLILFVLSLMTSFICLYESIKTFNNDDKNKSIYLLGISIIIIMFIMINIPGIILF